MYVTLHNQLLYIRNVLLDKLTEHWCPTKIENSLAVASKYSKLTVTNRVTNTG